MATSLPDDDPRRVWQTQTTDAAPIDIDEIRAGALKFRRTIRRRNLREHVAGAVVTAVFALYAWAADGPWTRTGALLVIAGNLYVALQIRRRGWSGPAAPDTPVIAAHRADLERQRDALQSVWRWYLLPYVPGLTAFAVGVVGVETPLDGPRRELQGLAPHMRLDRLEVELVGRPGRYEAGDLGFERRGELLFAGFFFTALVPALSRDWHKSSLTAIRSATRRRRRWHSAIWALVASTCEAGIERLRVLPCTDQVSSQ